MALDNKYRLQDLAANFKAENKEIVDILSKHATAPKSRTKALTDDELNIVFEAMTQNHQVKDIENVLKKQTEAREAKIRAAQAPQQKPQQQGGQQRPQQGGQNRPQQNNNQNRPQQGGQNRPQGGQQRPQGGQQQKPAQQQAQQQNQPQQPQSKVKQVHRVDTRGGGDVNLARYDERIDAVGLQHIYQ